ncbi:MAG: O-antigen ligase family protein, partial [Parvularculaceae bacterium]
MSETFDIKPALAPALSPARLAGAAAMAVGLTLYTALAAAATIIYPPIGAAFLVPLLLGVVAVAPAAKASPRRIAMALILVAAFLLPVWPVYLFVKLGPAPILTPPRLVLYVVSAFFVYDMVFSPWRRAQFVLAVRKSGAVSVFVFLFFIIGLFSLPLAEGRSVAIPEFARQAIIWLIPYCAVLTYCRRQRDFVAIMKVFTIGAFLVALIAIGEAATHKLMANLLSPFMADSAEWVKNAQSEKIRDGVFRAQASHTHPLSLGEHLAFSAPFALAFLITTKSLRARQFWGVVFVSIALAAVATNSRGAILVMIVGIGSMSAMLGWRFLKRASATRWRPMAGLLCVLCLLASPVAAIGAHAVISGKSGASAANSTQSRIDQMEQAWPKILKRPVGGYG